MNKINKYLIFKNKSVEQALKLIEKNGEKNCLVVDEKKKLVGSLTDGDIRRNILQKGKSLKNSVEKFCYKKTSYLQEDKINNKKIHNLFVKKRIMIIPVLNKEKKIVDIILRSNYFKTKVKNVNKKVDVLKNINIVIMAGGKGERLDPITRVLPKPLVPLKEKTAIENILESFSNFGAKKFFFTLNFKSDLIKAYFNNKPKLKRKIKYVNEIKPMGTAGGLQKLKGKISKNFIVSNCDVVFDINFKNLIKDHLRNKNDLTLVTSKQTSIISYGVCEIDKNKNFSKIIEKPRYQHLITTGLYVLNSKILKFLPKNKFMDMNKFIEILKKNNFKIGTFKINQKQWYDIGQLREYKKRLDLMNV